MAIFPHGRALVIGVGSYQNPKWNAPITIADAQAVADALQDPAISAYPPEQVQFLHDEQATCAGVTAALTQLA